jgi:FixJ family two-component response regulator
MMIMADLCVYVIDDDDDFRESTSWMLEGEGYTVKNFANPKSALKILASKKNYYNICCMLDIRMPIMTGLEFHDNLRSKNINIPIIYMTGHGDVSLAVEAMSKGAVTFLEKPLDINQLRSALRVAFKDKRRNFNGYKDRTRQKPDPEFSKRMNTLTHREQSVFHEVVSGKMNKEIAIEMGVSVKTIELHRSRVMSKMNARTLALLVKMYITQKCK